MPNDSKLAEKKMQKASEKQVFEPKKSESVRDFLERIEARTGMKMATEVNLTGNERIGNAIVSKKIDGSTILSINWKKPLAKSTKIIMEPAESLEDPDVKALIAFIMNSPATKPGEATMADLFDSPEGKALKYSYLAKGKMRPEKFYGTPEEAKKHSEEEYSKLQQALKAKGEKEEKALEAPGKKDLREIKVEQKAQKISREISEIWIAQSFLGSDIGGRFSAFPPVITFEKDLFGMAYLVNYTDMPKYVSDYADSASSLVSGMYVQNTNHILLNDFLLGRETPSSDMIQTILHEQLHYAVWLGGGSNVRWKDDDSKPVIPSDANWLLEGMNELHTSDILRQRKIEPTGIGGYVAEMTVSLIFQQIAGKDMLKAAYLNGDFTEVRKSVNGAAGPGAFENILKKSNGTEALSFLIKGTDAMEFLARKFGKSENADILTSLEIISKEYAGDVRP